MTDSYEKLAALLRTSAGVLEAVDAKMGPLSGKPNVLAAIAEENEILTERVLADLNLSRSSRPEDVYSALVHRLSHLDAGLNKVLGQPNLPEMSENCGQLCEVLYKIFKPPKGFFIKKEKLAELLEKYRPENLLDCFECATVKELIEKEGFASVVSALRFTQNAEWMHKFFDSAYNELVAGDFEEREVEIKILAPKWLDVANRFLEKKYHNVSHLKEFGVIFVIPLTIDTPGETVRLFTLLLHYLHEVPFYTDLFKKFVGQPDFNDKFKSLLRGDVLELDAAKEKFKKEGNTWLVIQRYLAKDDPDDPRLFMPHVNPEADHWLKVGEDLKKLSAMFSLDHGHAGLDYWTGLDFAGNFFENASGQKQLVSFDLIDLVMSLVKKGEIKYLYHQQEALWNKIFTEYMGREKMEKLLDENIIQGYFEL